MLEHRAFFYINKPRNAEQCCLISGGKNLRKAVLDHVERADKDKKIVLP